MVSKMGLFATNRRKYVLPAARLLATGLVLTQKKEVESAQHGATALSKCGFSLLKNMKEL